MRLRLRSKEEALQEETEKVLNGSRFEILATESDQVFSRRAQGLQARTKKINTLKLKIRR